MCQDFLATLREDEFNLVGVEAATVRADTKLEMLRTACKNPVYVYVLTLQSPTKALSGPEGADGTGGRTALFPSGFIKMTCPTVWTDEFAHGFVMRKFTTQGVKLFKVFTDRVLETNKKLGMCAADQRPQPSPAQPRLCRRCRPLSLYVPTFFWTATAEFPCVCCVPAVKVGLDSTMSPKALFAVKTAMATYSKASEGVPVTFSWPADPAGRVPPPAAPASPCSPAASAAPVPLTVEGRLNITRPPLDGCMVKVVYRVLRVGGLDNLRRHLHSLETARCDPGLHQELWWAAPVARACAALRRVVLVYATGGTQPGVATLLPLAGNWGKVGPAACLHWFVHGDFMPHLRADGCHHDPVVVLTDPDPLVPSRQRRV